MPTSVQGAKRAISTRIRNLTLATTEAKREALKAELADHVDYLYKYAKAGEQAAKALGCSSISG